MIYLPKKKYLIQILGSINEENLPDALSSNLTTHLPCRTVRIGSYKYAPTDPVLISSAGLKLEVPLLEDGKYLELVG